MKKFFATITLSAMFLVVGCVDLDELWHEIDLLKQQNTEQANELNERKSKLSTYEELLESLDRLTNNANSEIGSLKELINAMTNQLSVVSYKELADKSGYEITMSDGSKITLKHGTDGAAGKDGADGADGNDGADGLSPNISVKLHTDGLFYWTINGEFLLDADGNMIPAQGKDGKDGKDGNDGAEGIAGVDGKDGKDGVQGAPGTDGKDGKDGITPLLRVNWNLCWEMSLDGGKTWLLVKDANNNPIKAQGAQGPRGPAGQPGADGQPGAQGDPGAQGTQGDPGADANVTLSITESGNVVTIIYNGVTFRVPKEAPQAPFNPLSLVAMYNTNEEGSAFVTSETSCTGSGYFTYNQAGTTFGAGKTIGGTQYHLPNYDEWLSIIPYYGTNYIEFTEVNHNYDNVTECVKVKGKSLIMASDYRTGVDSVTYALRYKGTNMVTAWKYEYISDGNNTHVKITSRSLFGVNVNVDEIAQPSYWNSNTENDVIRRFPAGSYKKSSGEFPASVGKNGYFIIYPNPRSDYVVYIAGFNGTSNPKLTFYYSNDSGDYFTVRLFETVH